MRLGPHVVTQGTTQCRPPPGPGSRTPGRSPAVGPLRDDREATVLPKPRAAPPARGHGDGLSSMGQLRGHQARPGFGRCEAPLPRRTCGPPGASCGSLIRAASPAPSARSDGVRARRQPRLGRRGRSESSRHQRPRCQAGERPPSLPLAPLPAASARPGSVPAAPRAVMCPGCWRPAGQGACPPCPLGTPRILRNVRVCVRARLIPSRGKASPSAEFLTSPCGWPPGGVWVGASTGTPALGLPSSVSPHLGRNCGPRGQAGESAPPGFRSHPKSLNPRSRPGTLQVPHLPACSATLRLLTRNVGTPRRAVQRRPRGSPCPSSPTQGSLRGRTWLGRHTSPGTVGQSGMFVGVQSNKTPHSGRPPRMNADGQNAGRTPPAPNHGRCQRSTARSAETGLAAASASVTRRGALLRPGFARRGPRRRVPTERDLFRALAMRVFRCWSFRPLPKPGGRGRTLRVGCSTGAVRPGRPFRRSWRSRLHYGH